MIERYDNGFKSDRPTA